MTALIILVRLFLAAVVLSFAGLITIFIGSVHGAPRLFFFYLLFTQAIPLLVVAISWIMIIFSPEQQKAPKKWVAILTTSFVVYAVSFFGVFFILPMK